MKALRKFGDSCFKDLLYMGGESISVVEEKGKKERKMQTSTGDFIDLL